MHQAAFPGEDISDRPAPETVVPALLGLLARRPAQRPLPRRRPGAAGSGAPATGPASPCPRRRGRPAARGPRPGPRRGAAAGRRARTASTHHRFTALPDLLEPGDLLVVNTSATLPARARRPARRRPGVPAARVDARSTTAAGSSRCAARGNDGPDLGVRAAASCSRCPATSGCTCRRPTRTRRPGARLWRAAHRSAACGGVVPPPRTAGRSATATCGGDVPARGLPERLRHRARQRGDGQRRPAVHGRCSARLVAARASPSRRSCCTPASPAPSCTSRRYPERFAVPGGHRPPGQRHPAGRAAASSPSAPPSSARSRPRDGRRRRHPGQPTAGPTSSSARTARPGR